MSDSTILTFDQVTLGAQPPYEIGLKDVSFSLGRGDLMTIRIEEILSELPLADVAQGLVDPEAGSVQFLGDDWRIMTPDRAARCRGKIGRVFEAHAWISNLDVDENVTLSQRHHTNRPEREILEEAQALAVQFGLKELSRSRPAVVRHSDLRRAEWVRAFIGSPPLILLESPKKDVAAEALPNLMEAVKAARARGAAVIWITGDPKVLSLVAPVSKQKFEFRGAALIPWEGK